MLLALSVFILVLVVAVQVIPILWTARFVNGSLNIKDIVNILSRPDTIPMRR